MYSGLFQNLQGDQCCGAKPLAIHLPASQCAHERGLVTRTLRVGLRRLEKEREISRDRGSVIVSFSWVIAEISG